MAKLLKSVRINQNIYAYIENYKGKGFNEKFENIISDAMESEIKRLVRIKQLEKQIQEQEKKLYKTIQDVRKLKDVSYAVGNIINSFNDIERKLELKAV